MSFLYLTYKRFFPCYLLIDIYSLNIFIFAYAWKWWGWELGEWNLLDLTACAISWQNKHVTDAEYTVIPPDLQFHFLWVQLAEVNHSLKILNGKFQN